QPGTSDWAQSGSYLAERMARARELRLVESPADDRIADVPRDEPLPSYAEVRSLQSADPDAIRALYWQHHQALRALGRHLLGSLDDAEDLLHEVFVAAPKALRKYRGDCSLRTFLSAIAVKRAGKMHRSWRRYRSALGALIRTGAERPVHHEHPEAALERSELSALLAEELARLPFAQRAAVVLC